MKPLMTVEIHDVTPAASAELSVIRDALAKIGVERTTLLVVPAFEDDQGRTWDLRDHPDMAAWLREQQRHGSEVVLHGLTHRAPSLPPPGARNWMMHHVWSRGCAEFAHLDRAEASRRLVIGREILEACDLDALGFIAPAWQQSPEAIEAVASAGFLFTAFFKHVVAISDDSEHVPTPVLTFAAPGPVSDRGKRIYMRAVEAASRRRPLLRVALHPEDVHGARPLDHAIERIRVLLGSRTQVTYKEWLEPRA